MSIEISAHETPHTKFSNTITVEKGIIYQNLVWERDIVSENQLYKLIENITVQEGFIPAETKNNIIKFTSNDYNDTYEINLEARKVIRNKKILKGDTDYDA
tara:strand:- start:189 stop:491 length:303 start_codon:yes stop_codon:yes gene_type:complete